MPRKSPPAYRKHSGRDQAIVQLTDAETGHRRTYSLGQHDTPASRQLYHQIVAAWEAADRRLTDELDELAGSTNAKRRAAEGPTIERIVLRFIEHAEKEYSHGEIASFRIALRIVRKMFGETQAADFGPNMLRLVRQAMIDGDPDAERKPWARGTINSQIRRVRHLFKWAAGRELIPITIYQSLRAVEPLKRGRTEARDTEPVTPVPDAHVDAALEHVNRHVAAMIRVQRLTGMRPADVCDMTTGEIDASAKVWTYTPAHHKTAHFGHKRIVYIGPRAQDVLRPFLRADLSAPLFNPAEAYREQRAVDATESGKGIRRRPGQQDTPRQTERAMGDRFDVPAYRRAIHRACDKAGIPRWSPNRLRHNFATRLRREHGIEAAQTALGHRMGSSITEIYAEQNHEQARAIALEVG